jgi:MFS family permease
VLVVTLGRLGDMFGRVRIYNAGFAVFTVASILLSFDPFAVSTALAALAAVASLLRGGRYVLIDPAGGQLPPASPYPDATLAGEGRT